MAGVVVWSFGHLRGQYFFDTVPSVIVVFFIDRSAGLAGPRGVVPQG